MNAQCFNLDESPINKIYFQVRPLRIYTFPVYYFLFVCSHSFTYVFSVKTQWQTRKKKSDSRRRQTMFSLARRRVIRRAMAEIKRWPSGDMFLQDSVQNSLCRPFKRTSGFYSSCFAADVPKQKNNKKHKTPKNM